MFRKEKVCGKVLWHALAIPSAAPAVSYGNQLAETACRQLRVSPEDYGFSAIAPDPFSSSCFSDCFTMTAQFFWKKSNGRIGRR